jgi:fructokinase
MKSPIVGIGELLWDLYPDGRKVAGGAPFNFAFHCHQLGHEAVVVSRVGNDDLGQELRAEVRRLGLNDEFIQTDQEHSTGTVTVALDAAKVPTYTINENVAWDHIDWSEQLESLAKSAAAVCFGTLAQRCESSRETVEQFTRETSGIRVFDVNLRSAMNHEGMLRFWDQLKVIHWLKMNDVELDEVMLSINPNLEPGTESPLRAVFDAESDHRRVGILTRGSKSTAVHDWQRTEWIPAVLANVIDTVGAGDAFTAAMVCLHLEGKPLAECARFANRYAARVCEFQGGTPTIDRAEVERIP